MRRRKKYAKVMVLAGMLLLAVTGCGRKNKGTEAVTDTSAESAETQVVLEKVTYTATDGSVSIILPDSNWKNTEDRDGKLVFTSAQGEITVDYADSKKKGRNSRIWRHGEKAYEETGKAGREYRKTGNQGL